MTIWQKLITVICIPALVAVLGIGQGVFGQTNIGGGTVNPLTNHNLGAVGSRACISPRASSNPEAQFGVMCIQQPTSTGGIQYFFMSPGEIVSPGNDPQVEKWTGRFAYDIELANRSNWSWCYINDPNTTKTDPPFEMACIGQDQEWNTLNINADEPLDPGRGDGADGIGHDNGIQLFGQIRSSMKMRELIFCGDTVDSATRFFEAQDEDFHGQHLDTQVGSSVCDAAEWASEVLAKKIIFASTTGIDYYVGGMYCLVDVAPGGTDTITFTARVNEADMDVGDWGTDFTDGMTCVVTGTETGCSTGMFFPKVDSSGQENILAGDAVAMEVIESAATSTTAARCAWSVSVL